MTFATRIAQDFQCRLHYHLFDRRADRRLGIDASGVHWPAELSLRGENARHAVEYFGTPALVFRRALASLRIDPWRFAFTDLGCGKGRVLLLAAQHPFMRVEGVELSEAMHRAAVANIEQADGRGILRAPAIARHGDATEYDLPKHPLILYLFNSFGAPVMSRVLDNVEASLRDAPRETYVIYVNAAQAHCFEQRPVWRKMPRPRWAGILDRLISPWPIATYCARLDALTPASPDRPASRPTAPAPHRSRIWSEAH